MACWRCVLPRHRRVSASVGRGRPDVPADSVTHHHFKVGERERRLHRDGRRPCRSPTTRASGRPASSMSPTRATAPIPSRRPITFVFNGGPGASSAYLHLGALGPRIVAVRRATADARAPAAKLVDNPDHWLDLTDLVFIDPVGTGYSRAGRRRGQALLGRHARISSSLATFIDLYLTPQRPARLAEVSRRRKLRRLPRRAPARGPGRRPQHHHRGRVPDLAGARVQPDRRRRVRAAARRAAAALLCRRPARAVGQRSTPAALAEVERFALGPYLDGARRHAARRRRRRSAIYAEVARFTGLPEAVVAQHDGRMPLGVFVKEARRPRQAADQPLRRLGRPASIPIPIRNRARGDACYDGLRSRAGQRHAGLSRRLARRARPTCPTGCQQPGRLRQWNWRSGMGGRGAMPAPPIRCARCWPTTRTSRSRSRTA